MTAMVPTQNRKVHQRSINRALTPDEIAEKEGPYTYEQFMAKAHEKFEFWVLPRKLEESGLENIPQCDLYKDETQNDSHFPN